MKTISLYSEKVVRAFHRISPVQQKARDNQLMMKKLKMETTIINMTLNIGNSCILTHHQFSENYYEYNVLRRFNTLYYKSTVFVSCCYKTKVLSTVDNWLMFTK